MAEITQSRAERISGVARLLGNGETDDAVLLRLTRLGVEVVPGATAAAVTITAGDQPHTFAASDPRIDDLHRLQFGAGEGPVAETLRYNEARHARDVTAERRWRDFCQAAADAGFGSCIALPLHTGRQPAGAVALYAEHPDAFSGAAHDLALLFAAQGGTAVYNAEVYGACREMVGNLQTALEFRAVIEQAKGLVRGELGVSPEEAFELISRMSQNTNQRVREIAARLIRGDLDVRQLRGHPPPRGRNPGRPPPT